ncbi:type VII secretion protein EccB [Streptosporangium sp. KLBMP 9127]|nr:type VII secretion protein EccB [Streptosporangium sp. KLBMP 9127]
MQTRRDLYQAHRLMMQRLGMALAQGEPDVPEPLMRRHNVAMFCGLLVAVLVAAVFGIIGLLNPGGSTGLTEPGTLIVEEETGATYVYSAAEAKLLPVANYASARLLLDSAEVKVRTVSSASLAGLNRGELVGIPGAPTSLPAPDKLVRAPWSACVVEDKAGKPYVSLIGGSDVGGSRVGDERAMVLDDGQQTWVIWADRRMRLPAARVRAVTGAQQPRKVPATWLNALPIGSDFVPPAISDRGRKVRGPDGRQRGVGQIVTVPALAGAEARWYVLMQDGLAPISHTQATLLLQDPASKSAYGKAAVLPVEIDAATANAAAQSRTRLGSGGLPGTMPKIVSPAPTEPLCAVYADTQKGSTQAKLTVGSRQPIPAPKRAGGDQDHFDQVLFPPGGAALVGLLPGDGQLGAVGPYSLITDQGRKFAVTAPELLGKLGFGAEHVAPLPAHLLRLVPEGPALDPVAARTPVQVRP